jgi:hypothetical protein
MQVPERKLFPDLLIAFNKFLNLYWDDYDNLERQIREQQRTIDLLVRLLPEQNKKYVVGSQEFYNLNEAQIYKYTEEKRFKKEYAGSSGCPSDIKISVLPREINPLY